MKARIALLSVWLSVSLLGTHCSEEGLEPTQASPKMSKEPKLPQAEFDAIKSPPPSLPRSRGPPAGSKDPTGFKARPDGFGFPNYTQRDRPVDLTPATVERLCGSKSCARGSGTSCVLTGAMRTFMDAENRIMAGGHCEGMSVLSQAIYMGWVQLSRFDPTARSTYDLDFNNRLLQSDIAYYCATSNTHPVAWSEMMRSPNEVLGVLRKSKDPYTLSLYDPGGKNGHAVVAIRVLDDRPGSSRIEVYENEVPGQPSYIYVDTHKNTWTYEGFRQGNGKTKTLGLLPLAKRFEKPTCLIDGDNDDEFADDSDWEVSLEGPGTLSTKTPAKQIWRRVAERENPSPIFLLKPGQDLMFTIKGGKTALKETTNFVAYRRGQAFSLEGMSLEPGEVDFVHLARDGRSFRYSSSDKENVTFRFGVTYKGDDYVIKLSPTKEKPVDMQVRNRIDSQLGEHELALTIKSKSGSASYGVELTRISRNRDEEFSHRENVMIGVNETHRLQYGKWLKNGNSLSVLTETEAKAPSSNRFYVRDEE